jgi:hypothetical protein
MLINAGLLVLSEEKISRPRVLRSPCPDTTRVLWEKGKISPRHMLLGTARICSQNGQVFRKKNIFASAVF